MPDGRSVLRCWRPQQRTAKNVNSRAGSTAASISPTYRVEPGPALRSYKPTLMRDMQAPKYRSARHGAQFLACGAGRAETTASLCRHHRAGDHLGCHCRAQKAARSIEQSWQRPQRLRDPPHFAIVVTHCYSISIPALRCCSVQEAPDSSRPSGASRMQLSSIDYPQPCSHTDDQRPCSRLPALPRQPWAPVDQPRRRRGGRCPATGRHRGLLERELRNACCVVMASAAVAGLHDQFLNPHYHSHSLLRPPLPGPAPYTQSAWPTQKWG